MMSVDQDNNFAYNVRVDKQKDAYYRSRFPDATSSFYPAYNDVLINTGTELETPFICHTGHSTVYKGYSKRFNKTVAVKIIHKRQIPKECVDLFLPRELYVTQVVDHPNLAKCLHISEPNDSKIVIISEFYSSGTLTDLLKASNGKLPERMCSSIIRQLSEAVNYLHKRKVIHRDIKPLNILFDNYGNLVLVDYGFARTMEPQEKCKSYCGSKDYCTGNVVLQQPYDGYASDWYSIGAVLFVMLTGHVPMNPGERAKQGVTDLTYYHFKPTIKARRLLDSLLTLDESSRFGYKECLESEWMQYHKTEYTITDNHMCYKIYEE
uniref:Protein kinase domain-containing protein n=1 Tax=Rhabditophanes sp. KR3021 TaxID=114890 RepID=A0AC35UB62_9BILA